MSHEIKKRGDTFSYFIDGKKVGFAQTSSDYLFLLEVKPEYQGQGIGKELLAYAINYAYECGSDCLELTCIDSLVGYYEPQGFVNEGKTSLGNNLMVHHFKKAGDTLCA